MTVAMQAIRNWTGREWLIAGIVAALGIVIVGIPTDLIATPLFRRDVPPQWWAWPALVMSSVLMGMLTTTYVAPAAPRPEQGENTNGPARRGTAASVLTFFAVGCPVCNKIVLLALGFAGAINFFEPVQPFLQLLAVVLLLWALHSRLAGQVRCPSESRTLRSAPTVDLKEQQT